MLRSKLFVLISILVFILCGCTEAEGKTTLNVKEYADGSLVLRVPDEAYPFRIMDANDSYMLLYADSFYLQRLEPGSEAKQVLAVGGLMPVSGELIMIDEEHVKINLLLLKITEDGEEFWINSYDQNGTLLKELVLPKLEEVTAVKVVKELPQGGYAALYQNMLCILDENGQILSCNECPGEVYQQLAVSVEGRIFVTYTEAGSKKVFLAAKDDVEEKFIKKCEIKGNGTCLAVDADTVYVMEETCINSYDLTLEQDSRRKVADLMTYHVEPFQVECFTVETKKVQILSRGTEDLTVRMTSFLPKADMETDEVAAEGDYDEFGRRILYLYDHSGRWPQDSTNPIDAFNEQSTEYQVVFMEFDYEDEYGLEKVIASGEVPDLVYSPYNAFINSLLEKNVLEDITPYLAKSEKLSAEDLLPEVVEAYTIDGKLFALPNYFGIKALAGPQDIFGEPGWTVDEFLEWRASYEGEARMVGTRTAIYEACMPALLEVCIDREQGTADFTNEAFRSFLEKTKALNRKEEYTLEDIKSLSGMEEPIFDGFTNLGRIAVEENIQECDIVIKGYPSVKGELLCYIDSPALSIVSESEAKEGAYAFLEFYMLYQNEDIKQSAQIGGAHLWTVQEYLQQSKEGLLQSEYYMGEPCTYSEEQLEEVFDVFPYLKLRSWFMDELNQMIWEEITPYFENQKDLDTVCQVLQNRVQLYLDERK